MTTTQQDAPRQIADDADSSAGAPTDQGPRLWAFDDEECLALAAEHPGPVFAYRAREVTRAYERLRAALPQRVRLAYAVKANPHPELLAHLRSLGASFDVASLGELDLVAALAPETGSVFFTGPAKQRHELARALDLGVRVQAESWEDLAALEALVDERLAAGEDIAVPVAVNLRVHPAATAGISEGNAIIGGLGPSVFGIDEEDLPAFLDRAAALRHVQVRGLHVFAASNERDAARLLRTHGQVLALARRLHAEHGVPVEQIDVGGGLGVAYAASDPVLDVEALGAGVAALLAEHDWFTGELMLEPGRYLAATCGVYLTRVVRVKRSRGTRFVLLQAGVNHLLRPLLTGEPFPVRAVRSDSADPADGASASGAPGSPAVLAGPLCTSLDRLGEVELPDDLAPGDLLAFGQAGAYGFTEAMTHFLQHPAAAQTWVAD